MNKAVKTSAGIYRSSILNDITKPAMKFAAINFNPSFISKSAFGHGNASEIIVKIVLQFLQNDV